MRLIPAIDLLEGQCVRLYQGDFVQKTLYPLRPDELLKRYVDAGADWVHIVDLDGARSGKGQNLGVIGKLVTRSPIKLQVGGGVRSAAAIEVLLSLGVARVVIGSAAVRCVSEVCEWIQQFGAERLCLAFDVRVGRNDEPRVYTHGWARRESLSLWAALGPYSALVTHVLCTDIARDGTLSSPNFDLYASAIERFPELKWQASGGVRRAEDLGGLAALGVSAAVSGRALLEERMNLKELSPFLPDASSRVSTSVTSA